MSISEAKQVGSGVGNRIRIYRCHINRNYLHSTNSDKGINNLFRTDRKRFKRFNDEKKSNKSDRLN